MLTRIKYTLAAPAVALLAAVVFSSVILLITGVSPIEAFSNMAEYGSRGVTLVAVVNRSIPFFISGIAVAIGFKMNLFNIGVEGQYIFAAIVAAKVGSSVDLPAPLQITLILVTAMTVGALWSGLAGVMKTARGVHEVISTIMLNAIAVAGATAFLLRRWSVDGGGQSLETKLPDIAESGWFPVLFTVDNGRVGLSSFIFVAIVVGVVFHYFVGRTRWGYDLRATGMSATTAESSGVNPKRTVILAMVLSGAVAGLIGLSDLLTFEHNFNLRFIQGLGFTGIAVALLGRNNLAGIAVSAFVFAWLDVASGVLEVRGDAPRAVVGLMTGVVILAAVIAYAVMERRRAAEELRAASEATKEVAA
jgi:ABC-type uncharacterized transport system permease subunit